MNTLTFVAAISLMTSSSLALAQPVQVDQASMTQSYQRAKQATTDAYLTGRLITAYSLSEHLKNSDIHVFVHRQQAVLSGTVSNAVQRDLAQEIADGMNGLQKVESDLVIKQTDHSAAQSAETDGFARRFNDAAIKARVKTRLMWNTHVSGLAIEVATYQGNVILAGAVDSSEQSALAEVIARNTDGVRQVENRLSVQTAAQMN